MNLLARKVVKNLIKKKLTISIAESCTGGLLSSKFTSISGSSKIFILGLVTYSDQSKINVLKIQNKFIKKYGSVSKETCLMMLKNVNRIAKTKISVSITGIAGPTGGSNKKPVGLVYIGVKNKRYIRIKKFLFINKGRKHIQKNAINKSLKLILNSLK